MPPRVLSKVPTISQVVPGAYVNIVLKQDQPTGRTVHGIVQNVLTRGNHPRGIKVRLNDGRVGRVQTMASADAPAVAALSSSTIAAPATAFARATSDAADAPREQIGLDAYIRTAPKQRKRRGNHASSPVGAAAGTAATPVATATPTPVSATTTCPVCGDFEGDEAAVSHHVATHFDG
ncbi:hypothetical protein SCUCBS95973_001473 [Sporothrix curviconia]|uniref:Uncharacterized protein n=1 Tax=Sporothrix curviconia TaxID=1260050 RepID=A0ABP0AZ06_9PEZI